MMQISYRQSYSNALSNLTVVELFCKDEWANILVFQSEKLVDDVPKDLLSICCVRWFYEVLTQRC